MAVRKIFAMQNNFAQKQGQSVKRVKQDDAEGICTVTALQWAKTCLKLNRGIGSYNELGLSDHQLNALMAVWRRYDNSPIMQTQGMGLKIVGADKNTKSIRSMQRFVTATAPHVAIFWNSFHTMGYRVGRSGGEHEWFDNNHGYFVAKSAPELYADMRKYMNTHYREGIMGVRVVTL